MQANFLLSEPPGKTIYLKTNLTVELIHPEDAFFLLCYAFHLLYEILLLGELVLVTDINTRTHPHPHTHTKALTTSG